MLKDEENIPSENGTNEELEQQRRLPRKRRNGKEKRGSNFQMKWISGGLAKQRVAVVDEKLLMM